jgi:hypothetical protein
MTIDRNARKPRLLVRGLAKVTCLALLGAIASNL